MVIPTGQIEWTAAGIPVAEKAGWVPYKGSPALLTALRADEVKRWAVVIRAARIEPE